MDIAPFTSCFESFCLLAQAAEPAAPESVLSRLLFLPPPFNMVVIIIALGCAASAIKGVAKQVRIYADNEADRRLKREMIEYGLSADEAQRVASMKVTHSYTPACK